MKRVRHKLGHSIVAIYAKDASRAREAAACSVNTFLTRIRQREALAHDETDTDPCTVQRAPPRLPHTSGGAFAFELLLARLIARSDAAALAR